ENSNFIFDEDKNKYWFGNKDFKNEKIAEDYKTDAPTLFPLSFTQFNFNQLITTSAITLSEEQEMIRKMARDFADNEILPYCQEWDEHHTFPWDTIKKLQELGLMTCGVPAEYGGPGIDHLGQCIISEEICRGDAGLGTTL
ncbi:MAG TPA: acyl-CoA dehydrogenase family protein, partial [Bacteroidales bacterium]|nr:acyl-CoA dehydrogenase family protein [Bacteroidales bacterium]